MDKLEEALTRGVENIYPSKEALKKVLSSGKKLRIYAGFDPTGKLHIGHSALLKKLRQFQDLGHEIIVLIGDFTAQIGDPTDKLATRRRLSKEEVKENSKDYKKLIAKILDTKKSNLRFLHNQHWTNKLDPSDMLELASYFTVAQLIERDMFQERIKQGKQIYLHEFLYPVFQAYDAVTMDVDMQIGGNDQTFNMLAGRTFMKKYKNKEKFVLATKLLTDPTGKKMGKSEGNTVTLEATAGEMFGKIMSWPDGFIVGGFELLTNVSMEELAELKKRYASKKENPRDLKLTLAEEVVKIYHGEKKAAQARENFIKQFTKKELPDQIELRKISSTTRTTTYKLSVLLKEVGLAGSKGEARRLIEQQGAKVNGVVSEDVEIALDGKKEYLLQVGKRKFLRVK